MTIESHLTYLEEEVKKKEDQIQQTQSQVDFLKEQINTDKRLLKIMREGLESARKRMTKTENK